MKQKLIFLKNNTLRKKIHGGALQYVIFISIIIALILSAAILLNNLQQVFRIRLNLAKETIHITNEAISYALNNELEYNRQIAVVLSEKEQMETFILKKHWGIFDVLLVSSKIKSENFEKIALSGGSNRNRPALYLKDKRNPLVLVGTSKIQGTAYLPERGVKSGYIAGNSYYNSRLIYGASYKSTSELPKIKNRTYLKTISKNNPSSNFSTFSLVSGMQKINSFKNESEVYQSNGVIQLSGIKLTGNIYIQSDTLIRLKRSCTLKDVILIAPRIEIEAGVKGVFQAFATEELVVKENCELLYPTILVLYKSVNKPISKKSFQSKITILEHSKIQGIVGYLSDKNSNTYASQIEIEKGARIDGEIYCDKNLDLKGIVNGSVYTSGFVAKQFGSVYQNHLYNATINATLLPTQYAGLQLNVKQQNVVKWLY